MSSNRVKVGVTPIRSDIETDERRNIWFAHLGRMLQSN